MATQMSRELFDKITALKRTMSWKDLIREINYKGSLPSLRNKYSRYKKSLDGFGDKDNTDANPISELFEIADRLDRLMKRLPELRQVVSKLEQLESLLEVPGETIDTSDDTSDDIEEEEEEEEEEEPSPPVEEEEEDEDNQAMEEFLDLPDDEKFEILTAVDDGFSHDAICDDYNISLDCLYMIMEDTDFRDMMRIAAEND